MPSFRTVLAALGLLAVGVQAKDVNVNWIRNRPDSDTVLLNVGDRLVFEWPSTANHNVFKMADINAMEDCVFPSAENEQPGTTLVGEASGASWVAEEPGSFYFSSSQPQDCQEGQMKLHAVVVSEAISPAPTPVGQQPAPTPADGESPTPAPTPASGGSPSPSPGPSDLRDCTPQEQTTYLSCTKLYGNNSETCLGAQDAGGKHLGCSFCAQGPNQGCSAAIRCRFHGALNPDESTSEEQGEVHDIDSPAMCVAGQGTWIQGEFNKDLLKSPAAGAFVSAYQLPLSLGAIGLTAVAMLLF